MPASGPVYQPTTVTYEQQTPDSVSSSWTRPVSYLSQTVASSPISRARFIQYMILLLSMLTLASGLIMLINGIVDYNAVRQHEIDIGEPDKEGPGQTSDLIVAIAGGFLIIIGILLLGVYIRSYRRRKSCHWWRSKDMNGGGVRENGVAASAAMNPSTDLLVAAAQYAPVSEVAYQPPAALAAEERSKLMAENKECATSGEESDRMLESDPRIVLRPQSHVEEAS